MRPLEREWERAPQPCSGIWYAWEKIRHGALCYVSLISTAISLTHTTHIHLGRQRRRGAGSTCVAVCLEVSRVSADRQNFALRYVSRVWISHHFTADANIISTPRAMIARERGKQPATWTYAQAAAHYSFVFLHRFEFWTETCIELTCLLVWWAGQNNTQTKKVKLSRGGCVQTSGVFASAGLLRQGHRHLDGCVFALCLLCAARICGRQLCVEATQGASAI